ncbi:MAG TPA: MBL fold metallo-hydrolase [Spirochaetia bacterium]|nr:MBL fold metallo-hydrolase [Spirochaetia bacterium]
MVVQMRSLGAAEEVTGSKHLLSIGQEKLLIDCGAFQGKRAEADRKNRSFSIDTAEITSAILTHAHFDHCGLLPVLYKEGYRGTIYSTPASRDLASLIMMDSANIQARDAEYLRKQAARTGEQFNWTPLYGEGEVVAVMNQFVTLSYGRKIPVARNAELTFYDAGHILGSAIAYLTVSPEGQAPIRIAFTGDLGRRNKPIIRDPQVIPDVDYLVLESTYGDRLHDSAEGAMDRLANVVSRTVRRGGKIIIPAFAIERTQELIYILHLLADQKRIPKVPIYVDSPMATNATSIFRVHPECYDDETNRAFMEHHENPFGFNELRYTSSVAESKELNDLSGPAIIISADGMCEAGRIQHHLVNSIEDARNTILIVGYMAEHTLGRRIRDKEPRVRIFGRQYNLKAEVESIDAFSAHADYREIGEYLSKLDRSRIRGIFLVHGEPASQSALKGHLAEQDFNSVTIVKRDEVYDLG